MLVSCWWEMLGCEQVLIGGGEDQMLDWSRSLFALLSRER